MRFAFTTGAETDKQPADIIRDKGCRQVLEKSMDGASHTAQALILQIISKTNQIKVRNQVYVHVSKGS